MFPLPKKTCGGKRPHRQPHTRRYFVPNVAHLCRKCWRFLPSSVKVPARIASEVSNPFPQTYRHRRATWISDRQTSHKRRQYLDRGGHDALGEHPCHKLRPQKRRFVAESSARPESEGRAGESCTRDWSRLRVPLRNLPEITGYLRPPIDERSADASTT
jgi:hypothetical protein